MLWRGQKLEPSKLNVWKVQDGGCGRTVERILGEVYKTLY